MAKKNPLCNEHGVNVLDLMPGQWITYRFSDTGDQRVLLVSIEKRAKSYQGEREIGVLTQDEDGSWRPWGHRFNGCLGHFDVVSIDGWLNPLPVAKHNI